MLGTDIGAVVSRGGRPDLADAHLVNVTSPTLLIVGGDDTVVLDLNVEAFRKLCSAKKLEVVPGATHLFEEEGALEQVASLARAWFAKYL
jgi:pimeloyl-ACP methyl ester carboxylesterase